MIKRIVILQDEHLVIREMARAPRAAPAYAAAALGAPGAGGLPVDAESADSVVAVADEVDEEPVASTPAGSRLADVAKAAALKAERTAIEETLRHVHWNRRRAAEQLGVSYKTLLNKIKECRISRN